MVCGLSDRGGGGGVYICLNPQRQNHVSSDDIQTGLEPRDTLHAWKPSSNRLRGGGKRGKGGGGQLYLFRVINKFLRAINV